jgi:hypothetical protein
LRQGYFCRALSNKKMMGSKDSKSLGIHRKVAQTVLISAKIVA